MELLRILATLSVFLLHYCNSRIGGGFSYMLRDSVKQYVIFALFEVCIIAVNVFILISGYFMYDSDQKRPIYKPLSLLLQASILTTLCYLCDLIYQGGVVDRNTILHCVLPANYYVILYIAVYFVSPYINMLLHILSKKGWINL